MREHRWESRSVLSFPDLLTLAERLQKQGLTTIHPEKEMIAYIEEWEIDHPRTIHVLDAWPTEDVTLLHVLEHWQGDFFLLAGWYHTVFQQYQSVNTYCSIAHPWRITTPLATIQPEGWLWVGFRHTHGFIRVRLQTTEIVAPGEIVESPRETFWMADRQEAFREAIETLGLPVQISTNGHKITLQTTRADSPFFCSWPDAFGPCQFEFNSPDPFEWLVPASRLAATLDGGSTNIRTYLTGFREDDLLAFNDVAPSPRLMYRCSIHCRLKEIAEITRLLNPRGRIYGSLAEFHTQTALPDGADAAAIIGLVGSEGQFRLEVRLNQHPLTHADTTRWLEQLVELPLTYAPLPAFP